MAKMVAVYEQVTNSIIEELEQGALPWLKPWKCGKANGVGLLPTNIATGRSYHGINIPILWHAASVSGHSSHAWMTFKQALDLKASVRKGEKGTHVVFTKKLSVMDKASEEHEKTISMLRAYSVFNVAQIDNLPERIVTPSPPLAEEERNEVAQRFVDATKADIRHGGDRACFVPSQDFIALPPAQSFQGIDSYYATAFHELGHWSGHKTRLDRDLSGRFGTQSYAAEELVAELTSAFLCAHLRLIAELRHAGYIATWITLLRRDNRAVFTAASRASQAADFLRSFSEDEPTRLAEDG